MKFMFSIITLMFTSIWNWIFNFIQRQDPGSLGDDVAKASKVAMETRYSLLPYLYTLFHKAHTQGYTVMRPLHHE